MCRTPALFVCKRSGSRRVPTRFNDVFSTLASLASMAALPPGKSKNGPSDLYHEPEGPRFRTMRRQNAETVGSDNVYSPTTAPFQTRFEIDTA